MREFLFRAYDKGRKEYLSGGNLFIAINTSGYPNKSEVYLDEIRNADKHKERFIVEQYTGLTDKNGTKIFEGDVVESRASENKEDWERWIVTFYDGSFCFERELPRKRKHKHEQNLLCEDEIKLYHLTVIGNIHDNPELLKVR